VRNLPAGAAAAALHPVVAGAGFDGLVFHELRHTSAALAIGQGAHPLAIKERLGHASITVTVDRCGGLFPRLEEAIGEGPGRPRVARGTGAGPARDNGTSAQVSGVKRPAFQAGGAVRFPSPARPSSRDRHPDFWPVRRSIQLVSIAA
jgi:hypothetical protein